MKYQRKVEKNLLAEAQIMSVINKELYDALIIANVPEDKATAAAQSINQGFKAETMDLKSDISQVKSDISTIKVAMADVKARLALAEKLQWGILLGVAGLVIKSFVG